MPNQALLLFIMVFGHLQTWLGIRVKDWNKRNRNVTVLLGSSIFPVVRHDLAVWTHFCVLYLPDRLWE